MASKYKQWVADVYHCSGEWGQKMTPEDMRVTLEETRLQCWEGDYVPPVSLYRECAAYWNQLCELYPN